MSFDGNIYDPTPPDDPGRVSWRAAVMIRDYKLPYAAAATFPVEVRDDEGSTPAILIRGGEKGFVGKRAIHPKDKIERFHAQFTRRGTPFFVWIPTTLLKVGKPYVPMATKLERVPVPLHTAFLKDGGLKSWALDNSIAPFHRYVRCLWSSLRENRDKLLELGLSPRTCSLVFDPASLDAFRNTVDTIFSCFHPSFVALMNEPGATIAKLLEMCAKQTPQWPKQGDFVVYARTYLDVDGEQGSDDAYVGKTRDAARRHAEHNLAAHDGEQSSRVGYNANIASRTRPENRHVRILACNQAMGFQLAKTYSLDLIEQTAILALRTYSKLLNDIGRGHRELMAQQGLFLVAIDDHIREGLGFQQDIRPEGRLGTNIASPLFGYVADDAPEDEDNKAAELLSVPMVALHIEPQHPGEAGLMQYKMPQFVVHTQRKTCADQWRLFFSGLRRTNTPGASSFQLCSWEIILGEELGLKLYRVFGRKKRVPVMVVYELMDEVQPSQYPGPKIGPFRPPHRYPVIGLPKIGPYRDKLGLSALGMRVEWQDPESGTWYEAPIGRTRTHARGVLGELAEGKTHRFDNSVQMTTAIIQMLLSQRCLNPAPGFLKEIRPSSFTPLVQRLEVDFLEQTARWVAQETSLVGPVEPTTDQENHGRLREFLKGLQSSASAPKPFQTTIGHPGSGGEYMTTKQKGHTLLNPLFTSDKTSIQSASGMEICCDTCQIRLRMDEMVEATPLTRKECDYDDSDQACTTCRTLRRRCTFTPLTRLLELWTGHDEPDPKDYKAVQRQGPIKFPYAGRGPMKELMVYSAIMVKQKTGFRVIQEPWNCKLSLLAADDALAENGNEGDAEVEVEEAQEEEEEEEGEEEE